VREFVTGSAGTVINSEWLVFKIRLSQVLFLYVSISIVLALFIFFDAFNAFRVHMSLSELLFSFLLVSLYKLVSLRNLWLEIRGDIF